MIHGEPEVVERDGRDILVDENGDELVCRKETGLQSGGSRIYHRVDVDLYIGEGDIRPADTYTPRRDDPIWLLRRRKTISSNWDGCSYKACYGDHDPDGPAPEEYPNSGFVAKLSKMTVEEFDAAVEGDQR